MPPALTQMDDQTRRDAATATFGMAGVGGGAALRHVGLERAYKKGKRPPVLQELKMLKEGTKGRRFYGAGMVLGGVSVPAAVVGTDRLLTRSRVKKSSKKERRSFAAEGASGMKRSFLNGNQTIKHPPPAKLMAGNYIGGGVLASSAGGLVNFALKRHTKLPGAARASIAAMAATGAGAASLPVQSKIMNRASHGEYEATAYGVRRTKTKPARPSTQATQVEARASRGADPRRARQEIVGKYYGEDMTHAQKRARVASITGVPFVADAAQAVQAGRMAPPELRRRTVAMTYVPGQVGGVGGSVAGAYGAAALARRSAKFSTGTAKVDDKINAGKAKVRSAVHLPPKGNGPSVGARALGKTPGSLQRAVARARKPLAGHAKAAAVGALALGALGGQAGSQTGYGAALRMEDKLKAKRATGNQGARHGTRIAKRSDSTLGQTKRDQAKLRRQKEQSAALSMIGGVTGLSALGASVGSKVPHLSPRIRGRLGKIPVPALTVGAGLGGVNAFKYADIQHKEASAKIKKAYLAPTGNVVRRAKTMRTGFVRQTRTNTGIKTSSVRGSLG